MEQAAGIGNPPETMNAALHAGAAFIRKQG
jgi:hypothetical protein